MDMIDIKDEKKEEDAEENPLIPAPIMNNMLPLLGGAIVGGIGINYITEKLKEDGTITAEHADAVAVVEIVLGLGVGFLGYKYGKTPLVKNLGAGAGVGIALAGANELVDTYINP